MPVWVSPLTHDHIVEFVISIVLCVNSGLCQEIGWENKKKKIHWCKLWHQFTWLSWWQLGKSSKKQDVTCWRAGLTVTERIQGSQCFSSLSTTYILFSGCAICWTRSFVLMHLSPISVLCQTHGLSLQAVSTAYYAHLLFFTSWSPALFFYYRFISFWMLTFFWPAIFMGVLPVGTQLKGSEYASFSMHQLNLYLHMFKR